MSKMKMGKYLESCVFVRQMFVCRLEFSLGLKLSSYENLPFVFHELFLFLVHSNFFIQMLIIHLQLKVY